MLTVAMIIPALLFAVHLFTLDKWTLDPEVWRVADPVVQTRADCMVQVRQDSRSDASVSEVRQRSADFRAMIDRLAHARALPAAEVAIEEDPALLTLTLIHDCPRRAEAVRLMIDFHAIVRPEAPAFTLVSETVSLSDTAHPATGPAWRDGRR
ncbi:hypothetical protein [Minwuia sp.]|uniref:hypothetical protein n=1 Tax=Minwuia sp. TaxID=2493630 RepID=UPI003A8F1CCC